MHFVIPLTLTDRFAYIVEALIQVIARRASLRVCLGAGLPQLNGPFITIIAVRLRRYAARLARLVASGPPPLRAPRPARDRKQPSSPHRTPRGFAWLLKLDPGTASYASHLRNLLADPEMAALLAKAPTLRRTLRPLCHMLGIRETLIPPTPTSATTPPPAPGPEPCATAAPLPPPAAPPPAPLPSASLPPALFQSTA